MGYLNFHRQTGYIALTVTLALAGMVQCLAESPEHSQIIGIKTARENRLLAMAAKNEDSWMALTSEITTEKLTPEEHILVVDAWRKNSLGHREGSKTPVATDQVPASPEGMAQSVKHLTPPARLSVAQDAGSSEIANALRLSMNQVDLAKPSPVERIGWVETFRALNHDLLAKARYPANPAHFAIPVQSAQKNADEMPDPSDQPKWISWKIAQVTAEIFDVTKNMNPVERITKIDAKKKAIRFLLKEQSNVLPSNSANP